MMISVHIDADVVDNKTNNSIMLSAYKSFLLKCLSGVCQFSLRDFGGFELFGANLATKATTRPNDLMVSNFSCYVHILLDH